ncbi:MAG: ribosome silencing factor [Alphaproteobacteria bacterium]|nr:ribosome silencing factor [Alphaproteobacteria bacterium]
MPNAHEAAMTGKPPAKILSKGTSSAQLVKQIVAWIDEAKAEEIVTIDLAGKTSIGDFMIVASGRTDRHVGAIADQIQDKLKEAGHGRARIEGKETCDWVLIDTGDIVVHLFRPEVREFYNLEKMWSGTRPEDPTAH